MKATDDSLPFMSFPVDSWLASTIDLAPVEYATLHRLCCQAWRRAGKLPNDKPAIARMVGMSAEEFARVWPTIQPWFQPSEDGKTFTVPEIEAERQRALELRDKRRRGAVKTNREYWGRIPAGMSDMTESQSGPDSDSHSESHSVSQSESLSASLSESDSGSHSQSPTTRPHTSPSPSPSPNPQPSPHTRLEGSGEPLNGATAKPSDARRPSPRRSNPRPS